MMWKSVAYRQPTLATENLFVLVLVITKLGLTS